MIAATSRWDRALDLGLALLLVFTPLAFGAVEPWAKASGQIVVWSLLGIYLLKLIWMDEDQARGDAELHDGSGFRLWGRVRLSGLELPALVFAAVVAFQLVPLPRSVLATISPRTAEIYAQALPGYGEGGTSFKQLSRWLQSDTNDQAAGVPTLPRDPDAIEDVLAADVVDIDYPTWRPLSLTPSHTRRALALFLAHLALFVVVFNHLSLRRQALRLLYVVAGLAGVLAVLGLLQHFTSPDKLYWLRPLRLGGSPFGPFVSHNNFAGWMALALPVAVGMWLRVWAGRNERSNPYTHFLQQSGRSFPLLLLLGLAAGSGAIAFLLARSRGGLLAFGCACLLVALPLALRGRLSRSHVIVALVILAVLVGAAGWMGGGELWERYGAMGQLGNEPSFRFRLATSLQTLTMATDFPLFGTGLGTYREAFDLYAPGTSFKQIARAHNDYAQVLAETGLLGGLALGWALVLLIRRGIIAAIKRQRDDFQPVSLALAVGITALLLHEFVDFNLQIYSNSLLFVFLGAVLLRHRGNLAR